MKAGAIILAGGQSSRMGTDKALLDFYGKTNIERVRDSLREIFTETLLVTNNQEAYRFLNLRMVSDNYLGKGPIAGIQAGLSASTENVNFIVACDMPFLSVPLVHYLVEQIGDNDIIVPSINGKLHPMFSVFTKSVLPEIEINIAANKLRIIDLYNNLKVKVVTEDSLREVDENLEKAFYNMNSHADYENAKKILKKTFENRNK